MRLAATPIKDNSGCCLTALSTWWPAPNRDRPSASPRMFDASHGGLQCRVQVPIDASGLQPIILPRRLPQILSYRSQRLSGGGCDHSRFRWLRSVVALAIAMPELLWREKMFIVPRVVALMTDLAPTRDKRFPWFSYR
jgi:hypothetical protein